jgi:hypothetical protein
MQTIRRSLVGAIEFQRDILSPANGKNRLDYLELISRITVHGPSSLPVI